MLVGLHFVLGLLTAAGGVAVAIVVVIGAARRQPLRFALDRAILAALVVVVVGALSGLVILGTGGRPDDPLHLLYAGVALAVLPIARLWDRLTRWRASAVGIGGVLLALLVLRLFQTG